MTSTATELMYIRIVQQLPEYGHESFDALVSVSDHCTSHYHGLYYRMVLVQLSELGHALLAYL